jgi:hypothetical protein
MRPTIITLVLTTGLLAADPKTSDEATPEQQKASALVKQLGDKRYTVREAAAKQLIEMGPAAVPALTAGTKSEDEEVRNRSVVLLPQAKAAEWKRRAAAYLADTDGKQKHDLPLLAEYEKLVGKPDAGSRKLFAEMVRTNGELLQKASDRKAAQAACAERCKIVIAEVQMQKGQIKAEVGDLAAILFVDGLAPTKNVDWSNPSRPSILLHNTGLSDNLGETDVGPAIRKVVVKWFDARPAGDMIAQQQFCLLAQKKAFPEAGPVLAKLVKDKNTDIFSVRVLAIQVLGKVGGKEAMSALESLIGDTTPIFGGDQDQHRLGDAALAATILASGKKLSDFGLTRNGTIGFSPGEGSDVIMINLYGFNDADGRDKAVKKWKDEAAGKKEPAKK